MYDLCFRNNVKGFHFDHAESGKWQYLAKMKNVPLVFLP